jgi:hypothetical protein
MLSSSSGSAHPPLQLAALQVVAMKPQAAEARECGERCGVEPVLHDKAQAAQQGRHSPLVSDLHANVQVPQARRSGCG